MQSKLALLLLASLAASACSTPPAASEETPETARPAPPVRIERDRTPATPDLRGRPFVPTGSACELAYRTTDAATGRALRCEVRRGATCLELRASGQTWFFERNPVHPEEVTGFRVDAERRKLIEYPFTDLAAERKARGWSSLARLGVEPAELAELERTGRSVEAFGIRFEELSNAGAGVGRIRELAWSEEHQLPLRVVREGAPPVELESLRLAPPNPARTARAAHPDFAVQDIADWREAVHDHAPGGAPDPESSKGN